MKQYKGFTIIEMLAVIGVIGILAVLTLPNILKRVRDAKKDTFIDEAKVVYTKATDTFVINKTKGKRIGYISNEPEAKENELSLQNAEGLVYTITLDKKGNVTSFVLKNDDFCIVGVGDFLGDYSREQVIDFKDIGEGVDPNAVAKCQATVTYLADTNLDMALTLQRKDADAGATRHNPTSLTLKYGNGWYIGNDEVTKINAIPSRKNYYYAGSYYLNGTMTDNPDESNKVIDCNGNILPNNAGEVNGKTLFPNRQVTKISAYAVLRKKYFKINFTNGSGTMTHTCYYDETCQLPKNTLIKTGYSLDYWETGTYHFADEASFGPITDDNDSRYPTLKYVNDSMCKDNGQIETLTTDFIAHWKANDYTVTFNINGGPAWTSSTCKSPYTFSESACTKTVKYDSEYGSLPTPTRPGYSFEGWFKESSFTNKVESSTEVTTASNHTLYAKWKVSNYTITYDANGGIGEMDSQVCTYATDCTLAESDFGHSSKSFDKWNTKANGSGTNYNNKQTINLASGDGTLTLYAQWKNIPAGSTEVNGTIVACPEGYTSDPGAKSESDCYINTNAGYYIATAKSSTQTKCEAGSYCPAAKIYYGQTGSKSACSTTCTESICPSGTTKITDSVLGDICVDEPGTHVVGKCRQFSYSPNCGRVVCPGEIAEYHGYRCYDETPCCKSWNMSYSCDDGWSNYQGNGENMRCYRAPSTCDGLMTSPAGASNASQCKQRTCPDGGTIENNSSYGIICVYPAGKFLNSTCTSWSYSPDCGKKACSWEDPSYSGYNCLDPGPCCKSWNIKYSCKSGYTHYAGSGKNTQCYKAAPM